MPAWPWNDDDLAYYARKVRRAMAGHERGTELARSGLIWLALCGFDAQPVRDLKSWTKDRTLRVLREWITSFDDPGLRAWVEAQVGWPKASLPARRRSPLRWVGMRTK